MEKLFLNGLTCANCAQKIERFANDHASVESASLDFINTTLSIEMKDGADGEAALREITKYINDLEPDVLVTRCEEESEEEEEEGFSIILGLFEVQPVKNKKAVKISMCAFITITPLSG